VRKIQLLMGMPITVEIVADRSAALLDAAFAYFAATDRRFSVFKPDSEITAINQGCLAVEAASPDMRDVLTIAEDTRQRTNGYFDVRRPDGLVDPSGVVKGWAVRNVARLINEAGCAHHFVDAGGDIQSSGTAADGTDWRIGIRNPFNAREIVKVVCPRGHGIATSGTAARGQHIYNPHHHGQAITDIVSVTVIGDDVLQADLYATAAFAMGEAGIHLIEQTPGLEGYMIDRTGIATQTSGFGAFVVS
jgi:thiamine biosynthesis lipoprotein